MPGTTSRRDARRQADATQIQAWLPAMTEAPVFASRLRGRPLLDSEDMSLGKVRDVVILPAAGGDPPWVVGLVVTVQRHEIFVNLGRVAEISIDGVHLRGGTVDLRRFSRRTGEILASGLFGKRVEAGVVLDVGIVPSERRRASWEVSVLAIGPVRTLGLGLRHHMTIVPWDKHPELFKVSALAEQLVQLREMNPTDIANAVEALPDTRRQELAEMLHDEQLADVLEELPEQDQVRLLASLGVERGADVVEEMQPDDAADLLGEMPPEQRERLLAAMENVQAADLRRLLRYDATTAGGLMTSQPLIVPPDTPVAEVLAQIRDPRMPTTSAAQVYICEPPTETPTGRYLGNIGFQALLRQPPAAMVGEVIEDGGFVRPELSEKEVARRMAAYNLVGVAVCDEHGRLLGAITVDDVLDRILPAGWRKGETHGDAAAADAHQ
jgi:CBS domain-containing protein